MAHEALYGLAPHLFDLPLSTPPFPHSIPATLAFLLLLKHTRHSLASGPLHLLFSYAYLFSSPLSGLCSSTAFLDPSISNGTCPN